MHYLPKTATHSIHVYTVYVLDIYEQHILKSIVGWVMYTIENSLVYFERERERERNRAKPRGHRMKERQRVREKEIGRQLERKKRERERDMRDRVMERGGTENGRLIITFSILSG